jgi:hypothetical protein
MRLNRKAVALGVGLLLFSLGAAIFHNTAQFMSVLRSYSDVRLTDAKADVLYRLGASLIALRHFLLYHRSLSHQPEGSARASDSVGAPLDPARKAA